MVVDPFGVTSFVKTVNGCTLNQDVISGDAFQM
jgi:hypothetical protein